MGVYRITRNIEASLIDYLKTELTEDGWTSVNIEKTFARVYDLELPTICVRIGNTNHNRVEIGNYSTKRTAMILVDLFCKNDGQKLDLKDWIIRKVKKGWTYYNYTITNGKVTSKIQNGRVSVLNIQDTGIDLNIDKDNLDTHDRYRHLLTLSVSISQVED